MGKWVSESLGSYDCETCGHNTNRIEVETEDGVEFDVLIRVGCYGGDGAIEASAEEAVKILQSWRDLAPRSSTAGFLIWNRVTWTHGRTTNELPGRNS